MNLSKENIPWLFNDDVRPYVFVRNENQVKNPGTLHKVSWFQKEPLQMDPLRMNEVEFANEILNLETKAFTASNMSMPRWVFYDCAIMPGFTAGFAVRRKSLSKKVIETLKPLSQGEWLPISLFIIIPGMHQGEWIAHNLCSINSLVPKEDQYWSLGFLSKAFSLWYANVATQCGMTQWTSPSLKLHCHYGRFEVLTAFTPVHSYAHTLTYRVQVSTERWEQFFKDKGDDPHFNNLYSPAGFTVIPSAEKTLIDFQSRIESGEGPFYLSATEIFEKPLASELNVYCLKK
ncbi:MAG: hypothetical protein SGJ18_03755 [Pseudomonadota bacterium]|nr:hypothetical protein [Pseudomonadota bacterium]